MKTKTKADIATKKIFSIAWSLLFAPEEVPDCSACFEHLLAMYDEPAYEKVPRSYHNIMHIIDGLSHCDMVAAIIKDPYEVASVVIAWWYHDCVYRTNPDLKDKNEVSSAEVAFMDLVRAGLPGQKAGLVYDLVKCTTHKQDPLNGGTHVLGACICDMDLAGLAVPYDDFVAQNAAIRQEYGQYPDKLFYSANKRILSGFLNRNRIFLTQSFYDKYEKTVRDNIQRFLSQNPITEE